MLLNELVRVCGSELQVNEFLVKLKFLVWPVVKRNLDFFFSISSVSHKAYVWQVRDKTSEERKQRCGSGRGSGEGGSSIFEKSIRSLSGSANLLILKARNMVQNGFDIKYLVFPSCITSAKCYGTKTKGKLVGEKYEGCPTQRAIFFM